MKKDILNLKEQILIVGQERNNEREKCNQIKKENKEKLNEELEKIKTKKDELIEIEKEKSELLEKKLNYIEGKLRSKKTPVIINNRNNNNINNNNRNNDNDNFNNNNNNSNTNTITRTIISKSSDKGLKSRLNDLKSNYLKYKNEVIEQKKSRIGELYTTNLSSKQKQNQKRMINDQSKIKLKQMKNVYKKKLVQLQNEL